MIQDTLPCNGIYVDKKQMKSLEKSITLETLKSCSWQREVYFLH